MNRLLTALALSTALMTPAFAQEAAKGFACSAFMAMIDHMGAMTEAMSAGAMASGDAMATDAMTSDTAWLLWERCAPPIRT